VADAQPDPQPSNDTGRLGPADGEVEADETAYGGKPKASITRGMTMPEIQAFSKARKTGIMAMVERGGLVVLTSSPAGER